MLNHRAQKIYEHVKTSTSFDICENINCIQVEELSICHDDKFINSLSNTPEIEIKKTFELINEDGSYNRYEPDIAKKDLRELIDPILMQTSGTLAACVYALTNKFAFSIGGGFHHAMTFGGRGFCLVNDIVFSAQQLINQKLTNQVWIIDVDAHKGDGCAQMTENNSQITTFSIHMEEGWPLDSEKLDSEKNLNPWFIPSNIDIGINSKNHHKYNQLLEEGLNSLKEDYPHPDLAIIVQGSDPYEHDGLTSSSHLHLTKKELLERDILVYEFLKKNNIPQAYVISGGYGEEAYQIYNQFIDYLNKGN
jgi:acetoin utilization deacetylase AcuC-like enzyme